MLNAIYRGERGESLTLPSGKPKYQNIDGILIVKDGRLVFEEYFNHFTLHSGHDIASVTKSITSLLIGAAIDQGYLKRVDEKVVPYFPEYLPLSDADERKENITIEDLLTMRTGMECDDWDPNSRTYYLNNQPSQADDINYILGFPMETTPGSSFAYCTSGTTVLNALLIKTTGMELPEFAKQSLFEPLGAKSVVWDTSSGGWEHIDGILAMYPREMARLGLLILQNGEWQGEQLISQAWVEQSTREHVALAFNDTWGKGYGYLWWLSDVHIAGETVHSFAASGHGGQVIAVFPDLNMVVVFTGSNYDNDEGQPFEIMERFILPAVLTHSNQPAPTSTPATTAGTSAYGFPGTIDPAKRYLFYLHGKIIEDQGLPAVSDVYGEYEYDAILERLQSQGFVVISEQRPKNSDVEIYARKTVEQINLLLAANVPPDQITVVGASKGAYIAAFVSNTLENSQMNFVLLGGCNSEMTGMLKQGQMYLYGNILAIYDSVDELAGSCQEMFSFSTGEGIGQYDEIVLNVGTGHGLLYKPLDEWIIPTVEWARGEGQP